MKFINKWMELEKSILDEVTHIQKHRYNIYSLTNGDKKQRITSVQSTIIENLDNKEDPKRDIHGSN